MPALTREEVTDALGTTWGLRGFLNDASEKDIAGLYRGLAIRIEIGGESREATAALDLGKHAVGQSCVGGGT